MRALTVLAFAALSFGCQTYDFEPVEPLALAQTTQKTSVAARNLKPNLMILLDKSGSMGFPINGSLPACQVSGAPCSGNCPANCPTRISEVRTSMNTLLTTNGSVARTGLAIYPADNVCGASNRIEVELSQSADVDAELAMNSQQVNQRIQSLQVGGGTPTGDSLRFLTNYQPLADADREDFVLLLTDGLPNCNQTLNPEATTCRCTFTKTTPTQSCSQNAGGFIANQCLDRNGSVQAVEELRKKGIKTIVVGFGADTAMGDGPDTLNAMAEAGGFARRCTNGTDAECGMNNTCNRATNVCNRQFYQAANAAELAQALKDIIDLLSQTDICLYTLATVPSDPAFLTVLFNNQSLPQSATTWSFEAGKVRFVGQYCDKLKGSTTGSKVSLEFRIVETL